MQSFLSVDFRPTFFSILLFLMSLSFLFQFLFFFFYFRCFRTTKYAFRDVSIDTQILDQILFGKLNSMTKKSLNDMLNAIECLVVYESYFQRQATPSVLFSHDQ